jgi:hypothetical protein
MVERLDRLALRGPESWKDVALHRVGEAYLFVGGGDPAGGPLDFVAGVSHGMLSPEWANMSKSFGMSPIVAISSGLMSNCWERYRTTPPLLASGWVMSS